MAVQQQGQLQAEPVHPGGVHVDRRRAHGELDEVVVRAVRRAEVEVHPARGVSRHVHVRLLGDRLLLAVEAPVDLAVRVLAVGLVHDRQFQDVVAAGMALVLPQNEAGGAPVPPPEPVEVGVGVGVGPARSRWCTRRTPTASSRTGWRGRCRTSGCSGRSRTPTGSGCRPSRWWWSRSWSSSCRRTRPGSGTRSRRPPPSPASPRRWSGWSPGRPAATGGRRTRWTSGCRCCRPPRPTPGRTRSPSRTRWRAGSAPRRWCCRRCRCSRVP